MRIRKTAKLSSLIHPQGSRPKSAYVCQLNQSPWDVIPFPQEPYPSSLHHQFGAEDSFNGNGSLGDSIGAVESVASMMESEEKAIMKVEGMVVDDNDDNDEMKIAKQFGSKSQCEEEEKESKQEALLKSCNNNNNSSDSGNNPSSLTIKKAEKNNQLIGSRRGRARATKKGSSSASNPNEFYYYSGFGPSWRKRRGGSDRVGEISKNIIEAKEVENNSSAITTQNNTTPSSSSQIDNNEEFDYVDDEDDEDDDDDDDEDDENEDSGRKRMRKPIKARSLKSLM
ncbi:protein ecdysoneless homolog [Durio zibethinus]|uniref:Protein ecdysoneless homolog n=1 Tax=Durio zibethinus TaxID=66656 RepID=A0A6P6AXW8_DURZI|nr:protein ecdysoneless homolog [Durio zibethinus]